MGTITSPAGFQTQVGVTVGVSVGVGLGLGVADAEGVKVGDAVETLMAVGAFI